MDVELGATYTLDSHDGWPDESHGDNALGKPINVVETTSTPCKRRRSDAGRDAEGSKRGSYLHAKREYGRHTRGNVRHEPGLFVVRRAGIDGALEVLIPASLQKRLLYLNHDTLTA